MDYANHIWDENIESTVWSTVCAAIQGTQPPALTSSLFETEGINGRLVLECA